MKPTPRENTFEFEKVPIGDFIDGTITEVEYDPKHKFFSKGPEEDNIKEACRIVFRLDGCEFPHRSRWMTFSYFDQSNLMKKYLMKLVEGASKDMDFDLDTLVGLPVKTLWAEKEGFQFVDSIFPLIEKLKIGQDAMTQQQEVLGPLPEGLKDVTPKKGKEKDSKGKGK